MLARLKIPAHPVALRLGHHRTHLCRGVEARAEFDGLSVRGDPFHDLIENALLDVQTRAGTAALTVVEENGVRRARNGDIQVRVFEDDNRRLASEFEQYMLQVAGGCREDELPALGRARECPLVDARMSGQRRARRGTESSDDIYDSRGHSGLLHNLTQT